MFTLLQPHSLSDLLWREGSYLEEAQKEIQGMSKHISCVGGQGVYLSLLSGPSCLVGLT